MEEITCQIHWLAITVKAESQDGFDLYENLFKDTFGALQEMGHGGRRFKEIYHNFLEMKLYITPSTPQPQTYWHLEIPGQACEAISPEHFMALGDYLESNFENRYSITRLDFAFDYLEFTPKDVEKAITDGDIRTLAKRETLEINISPFKKRDNGEIGTYTVELGSNFSDRMITVYNKRGYTRFEFQCKDERAHVVGKALLLSNDENQWFKIGLSHLRDYVDFKADWWAEFASSSARANKTVSSPRVVSANRLMRWMKKQVAPALSVAVDVLPQENMDAIIQNGRKRRGSKWDLILESAKGDLPNSAEGSCREDGIPAELG